MLTASHVRAVHGLSKGQIAPVVAFQFLAVLDAVFAWIRAMQVLWERHCHVRLSQGNFIRQNLALVLLRRFSGLGSSLQQNKNISCNFPNKQHFLLHWQTVAAVALKQKTNF